MKIAQSGIGPVPVPAASLTVRCCTVREPASLAATPQCEPATAAPTRAARTGERARQ